ncbi:MAG: hypothetical protein ACXAEN_26950 [Candidatus Thorarchaeota archaeon]|jgi:hypothetical protein
MQPPDLTPQEEEVLRLIAKGKRSSQIATIIEQSTSRTSQIITSIVGKGYIIRPPRSSYQPYQLTLLAERYLGISREGREKLNTPTYNGLHKISFRFNVSKFPDDFSPDRFIDLNNWKQGITHFKNLEMRSGTKCVECWWDERQAKDPIDAEVIATLRANLMQRNLEKMGFVFEGEPYPNRQWKHSIDDPTIQEINPGYVEDKDFLVDNTPKPNTLHLFKAEKVKSHLDTPKKIDSLEERILSLEQSIDRMTTALGKFVDKFTPKEPDESSGMYG